MLIPPPLPKKKSPRSRTPSPVHTDDQPPPPLPPKPNSQNGLPPPIPPHTHTQTEHATNNNSRPLSAPPPGSDRLLPTPQEKPISKIRTLTPADAPIPPGYEVWEPEFLGQQNGSADDDEDSRENDFVLKDADWFQSGIPREIAEEILRQECEGSFIVRSSQSNPGCYALSMKGPMENILNFLIEENSQGVYFQVRNECTSCT